MRIDAHVHGMHAERNADGKLQPPLMVAWRNSDKSAATYIKQINEKGIEKVLILDPPEVTFELHRLFGNFVIPCPQVDLDKSSPDDISKLLEKGAVGIKFIAPSQPYGDDKYLPIYEVIRDYKALAVFHTGFLVHDFFDPGGVLPRETWININHMRPAELDRITRAFPDLKILMAHFGNPWWEEAWTILKSNKNVYADLSGGTACTKSMNMWKELFAPNGKIHMQSISKLCYASDAGFFTSEDFPGKDVFEFYDRLYNVLQLTDELRRKIDRENILMLINKT